MSSTTPAPPARPRARATGDAEAFASAVEEFARAWRRARMRLPDDESVSVAQFHLVEPLLGGAALGVGELAQAAGVSAPTATRMLDALARQGFCERTRADEDRRCVRVSLTPAGRAAAAEQRERMHARRQRFFEALEPAERRAAARLLPRLARAIDEVSA